MRFTHSSKPQETPKVDPAPRGRGLDASLSTGTEMRVGVPLPPEFKAIANHGVAQAFAQGDPRVKNYPLVELDCSLPQKNASRLAATLPPPSPPVDQPTGRVTGVKNDDKPPTTLTKSVVRDQLAYQCFLVTVHNPSPGKCYGLRVVDEPFVEVGTLLGPSRRWEGNIPTRDLVDGTSVINLGFDPIQSMVRNSLRGMRIYPGKTLLVVRGDVTGFGEDDGEVEMGKCEVLAAFNRNTGLVLNT